MKCKTKLYLQQKCYFQQSPKQVLNNKNESFYFYAPFPSCVDYLLLQKSLFCLFYNLGVFKDLKN